MFKTKADFSIFDFDNRIKYSKYYGWWWSETDSGNLILNPYLWIMDKKSTNREYGGASFVDKKST